MSTRMHIGWQSGEQMGKYYGNGNSIEDGNDDKNGSVITSVNGNGNENGNGNGD